MMVHGRKWGVMTPEERQRHIKLVDYILKEMEKGKTIEQISDENGFEADSVRLLVKHYRGVDV